MDGAWAGPSSVSSTGGESAVMASAATDFLEWLRLRANENGDVALAGTSLRAHSLVLEWRGLLGLVDLAATGLRVDVVKLVLRWAYTNQIPMAQVDTLCDVHKLANDLHCSDLEKASCIALEQLMIQQSVTASEVLKFADANNLHILAESAIKFLGLDDEGSTQNVFDLLKECAPRRAADILLRRFSSTTLTLASAKKSDDEPDVWPALRAATLHLDDDEVCKNVLLALEEVASYQEMPIEPPTAMSLACLHGDPQMVKRLLRLGWQAQGSSEVDYTPLHEAVSNTSIPDQTRLACVRLLLDDGASCTPINASHGSALHVAAAGNAPECVRELIRRGHADLGARNPSNGRTALHEAAAVNAVQALESLLELSDGSFITLRDTVFGSTALHLAAQNGHHQAAEAILTRFPAVVNALDTSGRTALHRACGFAADAFALELAGNEPELVIKTLLKHHADPTLRTIDAKTVPLHWLCGGGGPRASSHQPARLRKETFNPNDPHRKCIKLLLQGKGGQVINVPAVDRSTPLHTAIRFGFPAAAHELVLGKANIHLLDDANQSPLTLIQHAWQLELASRAVMLHLPYPPILNPDVDTCERCAGIFTLFNRRHHCRHCGACVCGSCSSRKVRLPRRSHETDDHHRRVCDFCFDCLVIVHHHDEESATTKVRPKLLPIVDG